MKLYNIVPSSLVCFLIAFEITGCQTAKNVPADNSSSDLTGSVKTQGVYTTLAMPDMGLDLPVSGYLQKNSFNPGESPAAVIVGYGNFGQQQSVTLDLIESDTGRSLLSKDYYASYGKAIVQPLAIRLSGNYELKLTDGGTELDTSQFTVVRTNSSGIIQVNSANPGPNYARGVFSVGIGPGNIPDFFNTYDDKLIYSMVNAVNEEAGSTTNHNLFAQRFAGEVVIQCRLHSDGHLADPKILQNTLDDACGELFEKALLDRSPYDSWPEDARHKFGSDYRDLTLTINFD